MAKQFTLEVRHGVALLSLVQLLRHLVIVLYVLEGIENCGIFKKGEILASLRVPFVHSFAIVEFLWRVCAYPPAGQWS